ncbi:hypothetical protein G6F31_015897 [Rhizopus arrhizus]|nr:hypothetical protein G6F31_015897 [Rhizopus arrhizus]
MRIRFVVDQHVRHAGAVQVVQRGALVHVRHGQDQPVDLMVHQPLHCRGFDGGVVAGGGQHDAVAGLARAAFRAFKAFGEHGAAAHAVGPEAGALGQQGGVGVDRADHLQRRFGSQRLTEAGTGGKRSGSGHAAIQVEERRGRRKHRAKLQAVDFKGMTMAQQ